jgi:hypothetical protein
MYMWGPRAPGSVKSALPNYAQSQRSWPHTSSADPTMLISHRERIDSAIRQTDSQLPINDL